MSQCHLIRGNHLVKRTTAEKCMWSEQLSLQRLCRQFPQNSDEETRRADETILLECEKNFRCTYLQAQFLTRECWNSLGSSVSSYVSVSSHKGKSLGKPHDSWKLRVKRTVAIQAALQPIPTQFRWRGSASWRNNTSWMWERCQMHTLTSSIFH